MHSILWCGSLPFTAVAGSSVSPLHKVVFMILCIWHRTCLVSVRHRAWKRPRKVIAVPFSPFLLPYLTNGSYRLLLFSFPNGHVPRDVWVKSAKFLHGIRVLNPHHIIATWYEPQQNPRFAICHCLSVMVRCSDKANNIMLCSAFKIPESIQGHRKHAALILWTK